jgi:hypothetical protein
MKKLSRREFFSASALTGYTLLVDARDLAATSPLYTFAPDEKPDFSKISPQTGKPGSVAAEPNMTLVELNCDVFIAGGGMAGVCAALAAARHGTKVILVQDRSRLGGNASSEVKMHIVGADQHGSRAGWRESGILEELRLEDAVHNPHRAWELWDLMLYDKVISEKNITLLLDSILYSAEVRGEKIQRVKVRCDKSEHLYFISAQLYLDCTGDSRLALESGAVFRAGRESSLEFGESLAIPEADSKTQGSSILFTARKHDSPMPYAAPNWARKIGPEHLKFRGVGDHSWEYGYWWIELGGTSDTIRDNEKLRFELLGVVLGVWDYIKNSGKYPGAQNWALQTVGMIPGKRESRRIMGDFVMTQPVLEGAWRLMDDGIAIGGWAMDDHPPEGFDAPEQRPYQSIKLDEPYNIALGSLYSKNIKNLMMAGRNISCSHVGFSSTRVMGTTSVVGQAAGTAAALCVKYNLSPREIRQNQSHLKELQQTLLRDDQSIRDTKNEDPRDLARQAKIKASESAKNTKPENILSGITRDLPGDWNHRWAAPMIPDGPWIVLSWDKPQKISQVQITFDTGFQRQLTLTASDSQNEKIIREPQPETVKDYTIEIKNKQGNWTTVAEITGNYLRLRRHNFQTVETQAIRIQIKSTNGVKEARIYEIRCYA